MSQPTIAGATKNNSRPIPPISTSLSRTLHRLSGASITSPALVAETTAPPTVEATPAARIGAAAAGLKTAATVAAPVVSAPTFRPSLIGMLEHAVIRTRHMLVNDATEKRESNDDSNDCDYRAFFRAQVVEPFDVFHMFLS